MAGQTRKVQFSNILNNALRGKRSLISFKPVEKKWIQGNGQIYRINV